MSFTAMMMVAWIYVTPCNIPHPADVDCRTYKVHVAAERDLLSQEVLR